jgi:glutathione S-transferase
MVTLYGHPISNYHNKIKLLLLEKGIPFKEELVRPSQDEAVLHRSPLGKIPFIETEHGYLSESQVILEYLEESYTETPLYPADPFERAKCRELIQHLELNVELVVRRLYGAAFFGGKVSDETRQEVKEKLEKGLTGFLRLAKFTPFVFGTEFTPADCAAWPHFTLMASATERVYGESLLAKQVPGLADYLAELERRPHVQQVARDRTEALARM